MWFEHRGRGRDPVVDLDRPGGSSGRDRKTWILAASLSACAVGALVAVGTVWLLDAAGAAEARTWRTTEQLEDPGRALLSRLDATRSDLARLGALSAAVTTHGPSPQKELVRHLRSFLTDRPWCHGVFAARADAGSLLVLRQHENVHCDLGLAEAARLLPEDEGFLAPGSGEDRPRLCLGVAVEGMAGRRAAILAEVDPAVLFGGLDGLPPGQPIQVTDGRGRTVIGHTTSGSGPGAASLAVGLSGWRGPAAGTWRLSAPELAPPASVARRSSSLLAGAFLLALAIAAVLLARAIDDRGPVDKALQPRLDPLQLLNSPLPSASFLEAHGAPIASSAPPRRAR